MKIKRYDLIVVGAGPAGLSAAVATMTLGGLPQVSLSVQASFQIIIAQFKGLGPIQNIYNPVVLILSLMRFFRSS